MFDLNENERIDDLQYKGYKVISNSKLFCFGIDAVILSHFATATKEENVIDFCTGNAIVPILMVAKNKGKKFVGIEIQEESYNLAKRNVILNKLEDRIDIFKMNLCDATNIFQKKSVDVITINPPYIKRGAGLLNVSSKKMIARHEIYCTLKDVAEVSSDLLKSGGRFYMVHRPSRLAEIIDTLRAYKLEVKKIQFMHPFIDDPANLVFVEAILDAKSEMTVLPPLIVYEKENEYTKQIKEIYNNAN